MNTKDIAVIGAAGFTGRELLEIMARHPALNTVHITSDQHAGKKVGQVFPGMQGEADLVFQRHDAPLPSKIPIFLAVPNDTSLALVPELLKNGHRVVDLSGAYRLSDLKSFEKYYKLSHTSFDLMKEAVYGMPEIFGGKIPSADLVSNPGCYATGSILPLFLLGDMRKEISNVVIDAKSGVSGAGGRTEDAGFSFTSVYENFRAYRVLSHQHEPEIRQYAQTAEFGMELTFTPHLLPLFRGILSTMVLIWKNGAPENLADVLKERAKKFPFIRFLDKPEDVQLAFVQKSNFLDLAVRSNSSVTVLVSAIDNLVKGAAGQAVQNMNLMLGLPETAGLLPDARIAAGSFT